MPKSTLNPVAKIEVFCAPQYDADLPNAWYFCVAGQRDFCWRITNPSGGGYVDAAYEGISGQYAITAAQANQVGSKRRQTLISCALYSARLVLPKYGETVNDSTEVVIR